MKKIKLISFRIFYIISLIVFICICSESASYYLWNNYLEKNGRGGGIYRVKQIMEDPELKKSAWIVSNPYLLYWNNPDFEDEFGKQYDEHGYRSPEYKPKSNELKILALGGSTTNQYPFIKDRTKIWTYLLQESLSEKLNRPVHIFNAGLTYGTTAELMSQYLFLGRFLKPDIIIFHTGGNDVAPLLFPNYKTDYSHFRRSTASSGARVYEKEMLKRSYTMRVVYSFWLKDQGVVQQDPYPVADVDRATALKMVTDNPSPAFRNNISVVTSIAKEDGAKVLFVGFLQARKEILAKKRPGFAGLEDALVSGVEKHDEIMREVANKYGQYFLKLPVSQFKDEWFLDNCHLTHEGDVKKAQLIEAEILKSIIK